MKLQLTVHLLNGEVERVPEREFYSEGERVVVVVRPSVGHEFGGWFSEAPSGKEGYVRKEFKGEKYVPETAPLRSDFLSKRGLGGEIKPDPRTVRGDLPKTNPPVEANLKGKGLGGSTLVTAKSTTKLSESDATSGDNLGKGLPVRTGDGEKEVIPVDSRGNKIVEPMAGFDPVTLEPVVTNIVPSRGEDLHGVGTVVVMSENVTLWGECNPIQVKK